MVQLAPIGILHTCFKDKFGIPRQPNLVKQASAVLEFFPEFAREEAVRELEKFSHVWLIFHFHRSLKNGQQGWSPMVRPPRLGGNKKVGVFASRSPFRPNPLGLSCLALDKVEIRETGPVLHLSGVDILDQTPVLDIKPYLPYSDIIPGATDGFAGPPRTKLNVRFTDLAQDQIRTTGIPDLKEMIQGILEQDPRPAYTANKKNERVYGIRIFDLDVKWTVDQNSAKVIALDS